MACSFSTVSPPPAAFSALSKLYQCTLFQHTKQRFIPQLLFVATPPLLLLAPRFLLLLPFSLLFPLFLHESISTSWWGSFEQWRALIPSASSPVCGVPWRRVFPSPRECQDRCTQVHPTQWPLDHLPSFPHQQNHRVVNTTDGELQTDNEDFTSSSSLSSSRAAPFFFFFFAFSNRA